MVSHRRPFFFVLVRVAEHTTFQQVHLSSQALLLSAPVLHELFHSYQPPCKETSHGGNRRRQQDELHGVLFDESNAALFAVDRLHSFLVRLHRWVEVALFHGVSFENEKPPHRVA